MGFKLSKQHLVRGLTFIFAIIISIPLSELVIDPTESVESSLVKKDVVEIVKFQDDTNDATPKPVAGFTSTSHTMKEKLRVQEKLPASLIEASEKISENDPFKQPKEKRNFPEFIFITLRQLNFAFSVLALGMAFATLCFAMEMKCRNKLRNKKANDNKNRVKLLNKIRRTIPITETKRK